MKGKIKSIILNQKKTINTPKIFSLNKSSIQYFHSFSKAPSYNILTHLQINSTIDFTEKINSICMNNNFLSYFGDYTVSMFLVAGIIRLLQVPTVNFIRLLNHLYKTRATKSKSYLFKVNLEDHNRSKFFMNLFINDLMIDCKRKNLSQKQTEYFKKFYTIECFSSYFTQMILLYNNAKVINYLNYKLSIISGTSMNIMISNELFFLVLSITYLALKTTKHPYLINFEGNSSKYFKAAFIISIGSLLLSNLSCVAWIGYLTTHCIISFYNNKRLVNELEYKSLERYFKYNKPPDNI